MASEGLALRDIPVACREMPAWLALFYVGANTMLCALNFYWFEKMIRAVRKRFTPAQKEKSRREDEKRRKVEQLNGVTKDHFE
jgi:hypothetical protein